MLPATRQFDAALKIIAALRAAGHEAYLAGGCVRDLLLGREPKDYDVATSATPGVVLAMFPRTFAVGAHFGVVLVADSAGSIESDAPDETGGEPSKPEYGITEVATFRSDGAYSDGRHPDAVRYTTSAEEDVRRRDFTINGLLLDVESIFPQGLKPGSLKELNVQAEEGADEGPIQDEDYEELASGAKAHVSIKAHTARLKSCPDTKQRSTADREARTLKPGSLKELNVQAEEGADEGPIQDEDYEELAPGAKAHVSIKAHTARLKSCPDTKQRSSADREARTLQDAVIDHVGGLADLEAGIVRAIGQPGERFEEDHLRMLRAVRFAARFGFELEAETKRAIRSNAAKTNAVSRERVRDELTKMLTEGHARRAFELLDETGLLAEVLPEVAKMKGVEQPPQFHPEGDVWLHTLMLLEQLPVDCPLTLAWGALLHDVGKPPTFRRAPDRIRFDGHVEVGVAMAAEICRRFRFSNDETRQILALVENHMRFADAARMKASTLKRFFRLENFPEHLALHRMDCMAASGNLDHWEFVRERYETMPAEAVRPQPLISGRELIAAGYKPGAGFKEMLLAVEDAQLEGSIATTEDALELVRERFPIP